MTDQTDAGYGSLFEGRNQSLSPDERAREEGSRSIDTSVLRMARVAQAASTSVAHSDPTRPSPSNTPNRSRASGTR